MYVVRAPNQVRGAQSDCDIAASLAWHSAPKRDVHHFAEALREAGVQFQELSRPDGQAHCGGLVR